MKLFLLILFSLSLHAAESKKPTVKDLMPKSDDEVVTIKPKVVQRPLRKKLNPKTNQTTCKDATGEWVPGSPEFERCAIPPADAK